MIDLSQLTEQQFNLIYEWVVLNEFELDGNDTLNEMETIMEDLGLEVFGDPDEV